jgi:hypothetical protein
MNDRSSFLNRSARRVLPVAYASALAVALTVALAPSAHAEHVTPPPVPGGIVMPAEAKAFLEGHAIGTQNYVCVPSGSGFAWSLFTPRATLFNDHDRQIITHFFGPNPLGAVLAAWQYSRDTSTIWGKATGMATDVTDPDFVAPGAIPWLRIEKVSVQDGPTGGDTLSVTTFVHRVNTAGGSAPPTGCSVATDVGKRAFVPYAADYIFYRNRNNEDDTEN